MPCLILYLLYTSPPGDAIRRHDMNFHFNADESQVYFFFYSVSSVTVSRIKACLQDITAWISLNKLKLNNEKTELLVFGSQSTLSAVDGSIIHPSQTARNIGVKSSKSASFHIRNISRIRKFLSIDCIKTLVHALVACRLDFCNSLLYGLAKYLVN